MYCDETVASCHIHARLWIGCAALPLLRDQLMVNVSVAAELATPAVGAANVAK